MRIRRLKKNNRPGILFSNEKAQIIHIHSNLKESQGNCWVERKRQSQKVTYCTAVFI